MFCIFLTSVSAMYDIPDLVLLLMMNFCFDQLVLVFLYLFSCIDISLLILKFWWFIFLMCLSQDVVLVRCEDCLAPRSPVFGTKVIMHWNGSSSRHLYVISLWKPHCIHLSAVWHKIWFSIDKQSMHSWICQHGITNLVPCRILEVEDFILAQ